LKLAQIHSKVQPVYFFRFSYSGALNFGQRFLGLEGFSGVLHGDDDNYLFHADKFPFPVRRFEEAFRIRMLYLRLYTNFFKYGNPTPWRIDPMLRVNWKKMTKDNNFLDVSSTLQTDFYPFEERLRVWNEFDQRFRK
jgi:hypothetical protein